MDTKTAEDVVKASGLPEDRQAEILRWYRAGVAASPALEEAIDAKGLMDWPPPPKDP